MAASYSDMYSKRKTELEDITNRHKKAKLDKTCYPVQQRLPSPSSPLSLLSPHKRSKLVTFELLKNQQYEGSPLLTPKDDDYESETDDGGAVVDTSVDVAMASGGASVASDVASAVASDPAAGDAAAATTITDPTLHRHQQLDENADYTALCATGDLLNDTKHRIETHIAELRKLRAAAQGGSKLALVEFYVALIYQQARLPGQHKIVRAPSVEWSKYHPGLSAVSLNDCTNANENVFTALNVFRG